MSEQPWFCIRADLAVLRFEGEDVMTFLQSKLTADTRKWRLHGGGYAAATDINGKTLFDGTFSFGGDHVIGVFPERLADAARAHLDRYVIMEDVTITEQPLSVVVGSRELANVFGVDPEAPAAPAEFDLGVAGRAFVDVGPVRESARCVALVAPADTAKLSAELSARGAREITPSDLERLEILNGVPRLDRDFFVDRTIPLEAGLWNGLSLNKGCYLGQEVLERMFSRGAAARRLARVSWTGPACEPETQLRSAGKEVGFVTSCASAGDQTVGMAYLRRKALGGDLEIRVGDDGPLLLVGEFVGGPTPESP